MKHNIKYILSVCIGIALTMGLSAQTLNSSYFMEKMTKRNQLNPALKTPNGYVSFPALGNFYLGVSLPRKSSAGTLGWRNVTNSLPLG